VTYFRYSQAIIETISSLGLFLLDLQIILMTDEVAIDELYELFVLWSIFCLSKLVSIINQMQRYKMVKQTVLIIAHAIKTVYPFIFVILMNYTLFIFAGQVLFGGKINSSTPENYLIATGSTIFRRYQHLNWNDFYNCFTFLYSVQMFNQMPTLINIAACARDPIHRDYSGTFFFIFVLSNNTILFNIFIGNIITICLEYFELEHAAFTGKLQLHEVPHDLDGPYRPSTVQPLSRVGTIIASFKGEPQFRKASADRVTIEPKTHEDESDSEMEDD
jgi:hypothetical protein